MKQHHRESAQHLRLLLERARCSPSSIRVAVRDVPLRERDAWMDLALGLGPPPDDGPELPRGCVPYLPCPLDALLRIVDRAPVGPSDVFVDIGSGVGRAAAIVSLLTGASALGVEVQPSLVTAARELVLRLQLPRVSFVEGDAARLPEPAAAGSVFFLYCPFSSDRLSTLLADLRSVALKRPIRICCVDLELPPVPWLEPVLPTDGDLAIYRSNLIRAASGQ